MCWRDRIFSVGAVEESPAAASAIFLARRLRESVPDAIIVTAPVGADSRLHTTALDTVVICAIATSSVLASSASPLLPLHGAALSSIPDSWIG